MHASSLGLLYFSFISKRNQTHQEASNRSKPSPLSWPVIFLILHLDNPTNIQSLSPSLPPLAQCSLRLCLSLHPVTPADHFDSQ